MPSQAKKQSDFYQWLALLIFVPSCLKATSGKRAMCLQIGACEPVTIDACQSFGTGGRPLLFTFQISSSVLLTPELLQQLPTDSYQCSFDLDRAALKPGLSYNITATATNFLLYSSSTKVVLSF